MTIDNKLARDRKRQAKREARRERVRRAALHKVCVRGTARLLPTN